MTLMLFNFTLKERVLFQTSQEFSGDTLVVSEGLLCNPTIKKYFVRLQM